MKPQMTSGPHSVYSARPWLKHYDYWVPTDLTWPARPLTEILDATAIEIPDRPATVFLGAALTFGDIKARSDRLAAALLRLGVARGDRVGIMLPNCPQYVIGTFAILRLGAVVVNVNPAYTAREVQVIARDSGIRALVCLDSIAPLALDIKAETAIEHVIVTSLDEYSSDAAAPPQVQGALTFTKLVASADRAAMLPALVSPDDLAVLQYTGGTTGTPKGAMLSHRNIFANVIQTEAFMFRSRTRGHARFVIVIPYFHIYAFTVGMMMGTWVGAVQVLIPSYDVDRVLMALKEHRPTYFPAVPTVFISLLSHPRAHEYGLDKVQLFNSGGAPCPVDVIERWEQRFGRPLNQGYGLSETSPVTHSTPQLATRKPGTIGLPVPGTHMKIVDPESGELELPSGQAGELCISGPQVMKGYWRQPAETAAVLRTGRDGRVWLHTGDIGRMDEDGYTSILQRKKDVIIVDGLNVYPSEIEAVLHSHPNVHRAAAVGVAHDYHGEVVKAYVVLKEGSATTEGELIAFCQADLAPCKVPHHIQICESLPESAAGKLLYRVLRDKHQGVS
jgi:long-chain acyl-CoA synthetase